MSVLAYWYSLLLLENMISAISQSQSTESSYAFFITPNFLLLKVTCNKGFGTESVPFAGDVLGWLLPACYAHRLCEIFVFSSYPLLCEFVNLSKTARNEESFVN